MQKRWFLLAVPVALAAVLVVGVPFLDREAVIARPLDGRSALAPSWDSAFRPAPVAGAVAPVQGLAAVGSAAMHGDGWQSDTHPVAGPFGGAVEVRSRRAGGKLQRQCATFLFRRDGNIFAMCGGLFGFRIVLIDAGSLRALATYDLPMRPSAFQTIIHRNPDITASDSSGGAYMVLDDKDRLVLGDSRQRVRVLEAVKSGEAWSVRSTRDWDLRSFIPHDCQHYDNWFASGPCDMLTSVVPGPGGLYWWTTRFGRVGTLHPRTGKVSRTVLKQEEIQNAVAQEDGAIYILSDHALYAFEAASDGAPRLRWREAYDRGSARKTGSINQGSGTTPTLVGRDYIAIADNADERINLVVLRRGAIPEGAKRLVCSIPMFAKGASATDNSMVGFGRSVVVENNFGYTNARSHKDYRTVAGGVSRIDIRDDGSGCDLVWTSSLKVPSVVAKLATRSGILWYLGMEGVRKPDTGKPDDQLWSLAGLDLVTGREVARIPLGTGNNWNNNWSALALGPDDSIYAGTSRGFVQVRKTR